MQNDQLKKSDDDERLIVIDDSKDNKEQSTKDEPKKMSAKPPAKYKSKRWIYILLLLVIAAVLTADILKLTSHIKNVTKQNQRHLTKIVLLKDYTPRKSVYKIHFFEIQRNILSGNIETAINKVEELTQADRALAYSLLGKALYNKDEYRLAADYFKKSALLKPHNKPIYFNLTLSYIKSKNQVGVNTALSMASANLKDKNYVSALSAMADLYLKNYRKAIDETKGLNSEEFIANGVLNDIFGTISIASGKSRSAEIYLKRSLFFQHDNNMAKNNLAMLYFAINRPRDTLQYLNGLNSSAVNYIRAVSYLKLGNLPKTYALLTAFPKDWQIPDFINIFTIPLFDKNKIEDNFKNILIGDKLIKAILPLRVIEDKNPLKVARRYNAIGIGKLVIKSLYKSAHWYEAVTDAKKANIYSAAGRSTEAIRLLETAHKKAPDEPVISSNLSLALIRSGNVRKALAIIKKTIIRYPNFPLQYLLGSMAEIEIGNFKQADKMKRHFRKLLYTNYKNTNSDEINMLKSLSNAINGKRPLFSSKKWPGLRKAALWIYDLKDNTGSIKTPMIKLDDYQMVLKVMENHTNLYPKNSYIHYIKGYLLYKLKRYRDAANSLYYDVDQNSAGYHMKLGSLLVLSGDYKNAYLEFYRASLSENEKGEGYFGLGILDQIQGNKSKMLKNYKKAIAAGFIKSKYVDIGTVFKLRQQINNEISAQ